MTHNNYYDVTQWHIGNPYKDIGEVINSIILDIKKRQTATDVNNGGKPGAVIYIPPGDYHLKTQVFIDISYKRMFHIADNRLRLKVGDLAQKYPKAHHHPAT